MTQILFIRVHIGRYNCHRMTRRGHMRSSTDGAVLFRVVAE